MRSVRLLAAALMLSVCVVAPVLALSPVELEERLQQMFAEANLGDNARFGVVVVDADSRETLVSIDADLPMKPASVTKLFSVHTAFRHLDPTTVFFTTLETDADTDAEGVLRGDLVIRGGGDAALGPRFQDDGDDVTRVLREWATMLKRHGITRIDGDIVGDDSYFANQPMGEGWYPGERAEYYMAEISALTFNDACIDVTYLAGDDAGTTATVSKLAPDDGYFTTIDVQITVAAGASGSVSMTRDEQTRTVTARGALAPGGSRTRWIAVDDPARHAAHAFLHVLKAEGIEVTGTARSRHGEDGTPTPPHARVLHRHASAPMHEIARIVLSNSQNLYAEAVGRHAALAAGHPATFLGFAEAARETLEADGILREGFVLHDASGLSRHNRVPPGMIVDLLLLRDGDTLHDRLYRDSMDRAGFRGTLRARLLELRGRFEGKTGSLGDTSTLAGYLRTEDGHRYAVHVGVDLIRGGGAALVNRVYLELDKSLPEVRQHLREAAE